MNRTPIPLLALVAAGGAIGSVGRWGLAELLGGPGFAWATFGVNVVGAGLIGVLFGLTTSANTHTRLFLGTGVLGGFTTFSTFMADTHVALSSDQPVRAGLYLVSTLVVGLGAAAAGLAVGALRRRREQTR